MSQGFAPFYDVNRTYEDNYLQGPFGAFAEVMKGDSAAGASAQSAQTTQSQSSDQAEEFLGFRVNLPFGIPAGPLLNERFTTAAFRMGFDLAVYKTVRSRAWGCNAFPNVLAVHPKNADGSLVPGSAELDEGVLADTRYELPISISNSFGVPSRDPDEWQPDMKKAIAAAGDGQLLVPSFQGSRVDGMDRKAYIADHVTTAHLVTETGAGLMEMNTSCPNEGHNRLLCHDPHLVGEITDMAPCKASPPSTQFPRAWWTRTATRRCREPDVTVPACAATPSAAPVSTWSAGSPPSVKSSASTSSSWAWAA